MKKPNGMDKVRAEFSEAEKRYAKHLGKPYRSDHHHGHVEVIGKTGAPFAA
jgi:hypothetical protein